MPSTLEQLKLNHPHKQVYFNKMIKCFTAHRWVSNYQESDLLCIWKEIGDSTPAVGECHYSWKSRRISGSSIVQNISCLQYQNASKLTRTVWWSALSSKYREQFSIVNMIKGFTKVYKTSKIMIMTIPIIYSLLNFCTHQYKDQLNVPVYSRTDIYQ